MKIVQEQILFDCLEQFEAGSSIEVLQAKYPHAAEEIARFLTVAAHLQQMRLQPMLAAKQQSQKLFLQQAAQMRTAQRKARFTWPAVRRTLLPLASLAMVTLLLGASFLFASASAVPGSLLYDTKRWVETVQLQQAGDATAVFTLKSQQNEERIREVKSLLRTDETAVVTFEGRINAKQRDNWIVAGVPVKINPATQLEGVAAVGAVVAVDGRIQNGHLYANRVTVLVDVPATSTPSATATTEPTATTATATATATPTTAQTATPTVTKTQTTTPAPSMTATSTPMPTEEAVTPTAVPPTATTAPTSQPTAVANDDNDNENDAADNGNDNANNDNDSNDNSGNDNASNDNNNGGHDDNANDNDGGGNDNDSNDNDNDNGDDNNDNGGGNSGSGGGDDNGNDNDRANDD